MANTQPGAPPLCPSAQPDMDGASVFGLVQGTPAAPRVAYLDRIIPLTPAIAAAAAPVEPAEVFRIGAPCASAGCQHFADGRCRLAARLVRTLPSVVVHAPPCALRPHCMWWGQEGVAACVRCPQIVTHMHGASPQLQAAADPAAPIDG
jgi:hypothetical protein